MRGPKAAAVATAVEAPAESVRGRFMLVPVETGGMVLAWATGLCDRCLDCECGTQQPQLDLTRAGAMKSFMLLQKWAKEGFPPNG